MKIILIIGLLFTVTNNVIAQNSPRPFNFWDLNPNHSMIKINDSTFMLQGDLKFLLSIKDTVYGNNVLFTNNRIEISGNPRISLPNGINISCDKSGKLIVTMSEAYTGE